ncbi:MAG: EscU/YscU/HrcU family type III secretion system export apparatus switch protein [Verrucomicrobiales bacterium]|jgi:flagellar biosynthetic protein FlhB|nr:EscU/YscU/HrcU family type III secretion system export apparatus switch protein [Verrucomicrobiales bacterium]
MADQEGEKIYEPTQRRVEEAQRRGQIPLSAEVQTAVVLLACLLGALFGGHELWRGMMFSMTGMLNHLHDFPLTQEGLQKDLFSAGLYFLSSIASLLLAIIGGGLLAGGLQSRFQTFSEVLRFDWERVNPMNGFSRMFSTQAAVPTLIAIVKLSVIGCLTYGQINKIIADPIFSTAVTTARIAEFLGETAFSIILRVSVALSFIASVDYGYQLWKHRQDMMMTRQEFEEEQKSSEGNPQVKAAQRKRRQKVSQRQMLLDVPKADLVVTNPTHLAVALRYDRKTMKAPMVIAKGSRLNALKIREIAKQHQVPIIENKPLARMLFRHAKVGGEIPAQFYAAVAELLAYVYRVNRYRYFAEQNRPQP